MSFTHRLKRVEAALPGPQPEAADFFAAVRQDAEALRAVLSGELTFDELPTALRQSIGSAEALAELIQVVRDCQPEDGS